MILPLARIALLACILLHIGSVGAQTPERTWTRVSLPDQPFIAERVTETSEEVFALAYGGLYKVEGRFGDSWTALDFLPHSLYPELIYSSTELLVVLAAPRIGIATDTLVYEMYVSEDHGRSFEWRASLGRRDVRFEPIVYVAGRSISYEDERRSPGDSRPQFYLSENAGQTWSGLLDRKAMPLTEPAPGWIFRYQPPLHDRLAFSMDGGDTWAAVPEPFDEVHISRVFVLGDTLAHFTRTGDTLHLLHVSSGYSGAIPANSDGRLGWIRMRSGVLVAKINWLEGYSADRGRNWVDVTSQTSPFGHRMTSTSQAVKAGVVFSTYRREPMEVASDGSLFRRPSAGTDLVSCEDVFPVGPNRFLPRIGGAASSAVYGLDGVPEAQFETNVYEVANGMVNGEPFQLTVEHRYPVTRLFRSTDGFVTADTFDLAGVSVSDLFCLGARCAFTAGRNSIYLSVDGGRTWVNKSAEWDPAGPHVATHISVFEAGVVFVTPPTANSSTLLVFSDDEGLSRRTLTERPWPDLQHSTWADTTARGILMGSGLGYRIEDGGRSARPLGMRGLPKHLGTAHFGSSAPVAVPTTILGLGDTLAAFGVAAVPYLSIDGGDNWFPWTEGLPPGLVRAGRYLGGQLMLATSTGLYYAGTILSEVGPESPAGTPQFRLSPNPATPGQTIHLDPPNGLTAGIREALLIDAAGRWQAATVTPDDTGHQLIAPQVPGLYTLVIAGENGILATARLVVL